MSNITVNLPGGATMTGPAESIVSALEKLGVSHVSGFYRSSTKGVVRIKDMHTLHLKNAVLKIYRNWVAGLSATDNPQALVKDIVNGPSDPELMELMGELSRRTA